MVPGFNTDFKYRGETYHIQTEDNGVANPVVVTLLYHKGAILASRRTSYRELAGKPGFEPELMALMKNQHKDLMRSLLAGAFDKGGSAPAVPGASGEHPADAAAAVTQPATPPQQHRGERAAPARPGPPVTAVPDAAPARPVPHPVRAPATPPPAPAAAASRPRPAALTLDEAIRRYLQEFAAAAGGARA